MNYLRERILEPIVIPLIAVALIGFGVLNLSRLFLAAGTKAVPVAALIGIVILVGATLATSAERLNRGTLLAGAAVFGLVLSGAGLLAQEVDLDHAADHGGEGEGGGDSFVSEIDVIAVDIDFPEKQLAATNGGGIKINYVNEGQSLHTFVIEGLEDELKLEVASNGASDSGIIPLEPGEYVFYCDVPGHRAAGMEGALTVTEGTGEPAASGEGEGGGEAAAGASTVSVTALDINFPVKEFTASAGTVELEYVNEGVTLHTLVVEGRENDLKLEVASQGDVDSGTIDLEAGTYTLYCDVPGHRAAGMEGTLTVT